MNCEICGKELSDNPLKVKIDGSIMAVCDECSKYGKIQKEPPKPKFKKSTPKSKNSKSKQRFRDEPIDELIEDYNKKIREVRESKKWSREELAEKINEKASVVTRIETGKMIPDNKLIKKLEKQLNIVLLEKYDDMDLEQFKSKSSDGFTLGDLVKIKKK